MRYFLAMLLLLVGLGFHSGLSWAGGIDLNTATESELETLPGIGPARAAAIIEYRSQHGPFGSIDQLIDVSGIGPATMANVRSMVNVGTAGAGGESSSGTTTTTGASDSSGGSTTSAASPPSGGAVDINSATQAQLETLPGIGAVKAAAILDDRSKSGPYHSCQELTRVTGIGVATVDKLGSACTAVTP